MEKLILTQLPVNDLVKLLVDYLLPHLLEVMEKTNNKKEKEFLTAEEVAKMCNIKSLSTLWNWKDKGLLIPVGRAGRKPLYKYQDVIDYLNNK